MRQNQPGERQEERQAEKTQVKGWLGVLGGREASGMTKRE